MTQSINSFSPSFEKGQLVNNKAASTITCRILSTSVANFDNAQAAAVKLVDASNASLPVVDKAAAGDVIFGFIPLDKFKNSYAAGDIVEVASFGQEMWMEAGAAINGGATIEIVPATNKVIANAGTNTIAGINLLKVSGDGALARILIQTPKINQN